MITLYSTGCPKCKVIETKLNNAKVDYTIVNDQDELVEIGKEHRILSAPILEVDGVYMDFKKANDWIRDTYYPKLEC